MKTHLKKQDEENTKNEFPSIFDAPMDDFHELFLIAAEMHFLIQNQPYGAVMFQGKPFQESFTQQHHLEVLNKAEVKVYGGNLTEDGFSSRKKSA